ncbi:TPA: AAA family ATPase [Klebsiella variicola subsp. variicola]|nr:AAA family ATPase [Klebsiella variicola subsp. variicola]
MKFLQLKIENFMVIGEATVDLDARGLLLIQGINSADSSAASNGAGKSTLMNALMWCLYGETATGYKSDDVLSSHNPKNCRVTVMIEDEGQKYAIIRHRNHKEFKNRLLVRSEDGDLTKGKDTLTQQLVERLIGSSKDVFMASIYASQEAMPDLPGMSDKNLKEIVEEAAGVTRLTKAYAVARERANNAASQVSIIQTKIDAKLSVIDTTEETIGRLRESSDRWVETTKESADRARILKNNAEVALTEHQMSHSDDDIEIERIKRRIQEEQAKMSGRAEHDAKVSKANTIVATMRADIRSLVAEKDRKVKQIQRHQKDAEVVDSKIGSPCTTCGKPYCEEDLGAVRASHKALARQVLEEAKDVAVKHKTLAENLEKAEAIYDTLVAATPDVSAITATISSLNTQLTKLNASKSEENMLASRVKQADDALKQIMEAKNPHTANITQLEKTLSETRKTFKELKESMGEAKARHELLERAKAVYAPSGVRSHILASITPFLNAKTSEYLSTLSDGNITAEWSTMEETKKGEVRDRFNIAVEKTGFSRDFRGLSGGEKRKVRIACALALQDLVANRASKNIELFIGDEIDDALDAAGLERLMSILEMKARERGTVMIISHKEMKSWFRETITLEVKDGRSYVL